MEKIKKLRALIKFNNLDGYLIPKNDEFFNEYIPAEKDNLKFISNFSGSYGFAIIFKKKNYLFVDGRYTLQAKKQSGKKFIVLTIPQKLPFNILKNKKLIIGFDPRLHTNQSLSKFFKKTKCILIPIKINLIKKIKKINHKNKTKKIFL